MTRTTKNGNRGTSQENAAPWDPIVGLWLGFWGGPREFATKNGYAL